MSGPYRQLRDRASRRGLDWMAAMAASGEHLLATARHGDLQRWHAALRALPAAEPCFDGARAAPVLGRPVADPNELANLLMALHPWRKGPLRVGGVLVDTEWRSDRKWDRIAGHFDLRGHRVLDIGCGNGYFGWRMLAAGAESVVGVDPTLVFVMQWLACRHFAGDVPNHVLPLGVDDLPAEAGGFDTVFSMGVLYHRRDAVGHLRRLASLARPAGQVVVETLVLGGDAEDMLVPDGRYARMRNVRAIPSVSRLTRWIGDAGLRDIEVLDVSRTTVAEQRSSPWMRFESLAECLDPDNPGLTVEGHPAPLRCAVRCTAPGGR